MPDKCPFCGETATNSLVQQATLHGYDCTSCGYYQIDRLTVSLLEHYPEERKAVSHWLWNDRQVTPFRQPPIRFDEIETVQAVAARCPSTASAKASALLAFLVRQSHGRLGTTVAFSPQELQHAAYANSYEEAAAILEWLTQKGFTGKLLSCAPKEFATKVTMEGFEAIERHALGPRKIVFISSTCDDLIDIRAELAEHLETKGYLAKLSEDGERFAVDPKNDTIATCLRNLESADVVVNLIDRRYGWQMPDGESQGLSATHIEVRHAWSIGKPVLFFMRERAWHDRAALLRDANSGSGWVEPIDQAARLKWLGFVDEIANSPKHVDRSNWITLFRSSVDLKKLATKRLSDLYR